MVRNTTTAPRLPQTDQRGATGRRATSPATTSSLAPIRFETPCTVNTAYSHDTNGLLATRGWMARASTAVNLNAPK